MKKNITSLLFPLILLTVNYTMGQSKSIENKIDALLKKMTLEEKIGQMNQYNGFWEITGPAPDGGDSKKKYDHLKKGLVGSVLNVRGVENVQALQKLVVEESRLGIPLIFGFDVIHGYKTIAPIPLAESASWDLEAIEQSARIAATEAAAVGINWTFAPMIDISRDARWGRVMEGAGEDTFLGAKIAEARIKGFQGDDLSAPHTIAATAKHFAAYGFSESGKDYNTVDIGTYTLHNIVFPPFKTAVENNVRSVMNAFNVLNGIPATGNAFLQRDILKKAWNFDGFVISDWSSGAEMITHGYAKDLKEVAEISVNAGSDMDMESYAYIEHLEGLVKEGKVSESTIDDAVRRILRVKFELGLFDDPYKYCNLDREKTMVYNAKHLKEALDMAKKSIVLLKNERQLLPLSQKQKNIAVIGSLANDKNSPLGSWRLAADDYSAVSVLEGIDKYTNNVSYVKGADLETEATSFIREVRINETDTSGFKEAVEVAKKSEIVIMVLGEHGFQSGEARSRTKIGLPGVQQALLESVYQVNKNIILVLMNGRPLSITWADKHIPVILETWHLGTQSGHAIAQVLFGDYNPSGKLTMTFPRNVGQIPIYYNHYNTGRAGEKDVVFWTHYIDEVNQPLYPFGYGLSYTKFDYSNLRIGTFENGKITVEVTVKNTGKYTGEEVTQLYIRDKASMPVRPIKELKGFQKYELKPGASKTVQFVLTQQELGYYDSDGTFLDGVGEFEVMVGTNSQEGLKGQFIID